MPANIREGIYNTEYFSGAQTAMYIGDVWVDEVTSISYSVNQNRAPLYGYADTLFRDMAKGKVLVQGTFTINFKESGYLFLILDRYRTIMKGKPSLMNVNHGSKIEGTLNGGPFLNSSLATKQTVESLLNNDGTISQLQRNLIFNGLAAYDTEKKRFAIDTNSAYASLTGYPVSERTTDASVGGEDVFEAFEDAVWGKTQNQLDSDTRRADDARLSPFDIYISFGDFARDNSVNHTIQKLSNVYIIGSAKEVIIDGQPIQEQYSFIARNLV